MRKQIRKLKRRLSKSFGRNRHLFVLGAIAAIAAVGVILNSTTMNANYTNLLSLIAKGESRGNYNAYFGNASNSDIIFTDMTVGEVIDWQRQYVEQGSPSNAVGKYQFISPTLVGLVDELGVDRDSKFSPQLQDELAIHLLKRRGVDDYLRGKISREQFAHNLSKEWAALPRVLGDRPYASYYAGDGLNHVQVSVDEVIAAIETLKEPADS